MTNTSVRPSGLTALAVLCFVFGGLTAFGSLINLAALGCVMSLSVGGLVPNMTNYVLKIVLDALSAALMIVSGVGYLKMNRVTGRILGNVAALLVIISVTFSLFFPVYSVTSSINISTIISLCWPLMILVFANFVFRDIWAASSKPGESGFLSKIKGPQSLLIAVYSFRQGLRGGPGLLSCLIFLVAGLFTAQLLFLPLEFATGQVSDRMSGTKVEISESATLSAVLTTGVPILNGILGEGAEANSTAYLGNATEATSWGSFLLLHRPGFYSLFFLVFTWVFPVIVILAAFDQIAGDNKNHGLRYLMLRARRADFYAGKYISTVALAAVLIFTLFASIFLYVQLKLGAYSTGDAALWCLYGAFAFFLMALPYVSVAMSFSAITVSSIGSFGASLGFIIAMLIPGLVANAWKPAGYLVYLFPAEAGKYLFHPDWWRALIAGFGLVAYAVAYAIPGILWFKKRDI